MTNIHPCFQYKDIDPEVAQIVIGVFDRHTWYLSEEASVLAMCSSKLSDEVKKDLAEKLMSSNKPVEYTPGKPNLPKVSESSQLTDFIGSNSWLVLDILSLRGDWLDKPVAEWESSGEFQTFKTYAKSLKVVNDTAERGIKLWSDYILRYSHLR